MDPVADTAAEKAISGRATRHFVEFLCLCIAVCLAAAPKNSVAQDATGEYQVKAAFVFHFVQLVDWPSDAPNGSEQPVSLCLFDDEPNRKEFESIIDGKSFGDRVLRVRMVHQQQDIRGCSILFLSRDEIRRQNEALRDLQGQPVLTIGETDNFLKDGGMIRFHLEDGRVRFDINLPASDAAKLRISSRLLLLASQVLRDPAAEHGGG